ncbi:NAD(P)H-quinone oxidoreductase [Brucella sp. RRSP16]|uniref:PIG3 family NAD(P)H quinone oxidoreductase n=2 Tax=Brucella intermedia TaxID=94625 RepID=A0ABR6AT82_9HYPH|nr:MULTISPECIES: NAD(P)H-quinone oxidoreductase [Brucella/Ochrobactrum group]ERI12407.1 NAD(P)H quinone oxidoreductase [Ochrobactrum sp. EGD-AQ16]KAB2693534.1 zinc-binding dehydrogenase [Brucella intermedia]KAB2708000.1 zinc-binding dehydrogenase [Brucella intermedia]MBA8852674.1 putative PIG3 family NAD(P)H quinone oxidoreductase [Brucella intermedia]MCH6204441.1 NAD(P)H-quinone oxidoreductase [Brucella ciceri]
MMTDLPSQMTAIEISEPGRPHMLRPVQRSVPEPKESEILVRVRAAGVNRPDVLQRLGQYAPPPGASDIPGLEIAGDIVAVGSGVKRFKLGDQVVALLAGGGYAEYAVVHETNALPLPSGYGYIEAAAIPETFFTVWHNVFERGGLKKGETFLVHGGSSGIGTTAIQLAKAFGATVIATAGSKEKCDACLKLGADRAVNYRDEDFVEVVKDVTKGRGADVILDMVGGDYVDRNYKAAAEDGRIVQIAFLNGAKATANFALLMTKRLTHTGSTLRPRPVEFKAGIARELEAKIWPLLAQRRVAPVMDMIFSLKDTWRAHERMEEGRHIGKIVLDIA